MPTPAWVFTWNHSWGCFTQPWKEKQGRRLLAERIRSPVSMPPLYLPPWYETPSPGHTMGRRRRRRRWRRGGLATSCDCYNEWKQWMIEWLNKRNVRGLCAATVWVLGVHEVRVIHSVGVDNELGRVEKTNSIVMPLQVLFSVSHIQR